MERMLKTLERIVGGNHLNNWQSVVIRVNGKRSQIEKQESIWILIQWIFKMAFSEKRWLHSKWLFQNRSKL